MRRILAALLLAFLPLQFSWSAVAGYCEHELRIGAGHVGHHEHEHQGIAGVDADTTDAKDKAKGSIDLDCSQCHGLCLGLLAAPDGLTGALSASLPRVCADREANAQTPARPERPNWAPLA